ncbi:hypothetical protein V490_05560, partial [Pseudogymnoascus sp. VKM F-3557]
TAIVTINVFRLKVTQNAVETPDPDEPRDRKCSSQNIRRGPLIAYASGRNLESHQQPSPRNFYTSHGHHSNILTAVTLVRRLDCCVVPVDSTEIMLIGDDKYACDACIRGHRAVKCNHSVLILKLADTCCCSHGGRCSCALKKTHSDPVLENSTSMVSTTEILLPSTLQTSSENPFLISATSHHVPAPKHTEMAHPWALTYNVPGADSTQCAAPPSLSNDSIEHLPYLSTVDTFRGDFGIPNTVINAQMEQTVIDPELGPLDLVDPSNTEPLNSHLPPFDMSSFDSLPSSLDYPLNFDDLDTIHEIDLSLVPANCGFNFD